MFLSELPIGKQAYIAKLVSDASLYSRLEKLGFEAGALVEILHHGFPCKNPISVRIEDHTIALGKSEADSIIVELQNDKS